MSTDNNYRVNAIYDRLVTGQATAKHELFHFKMHQHNNNDGFIWQHILTFFVCGFVYAIRHDA